MIVGLSEVAAHDPTICQLADLRSVGMLFGNTVRNRGSKPAVPLMIQNGRTKRCNGAGLARFRQWIVNHPGPLIATVMPLNQW